MFGGAKKTFGAAPANTGFGFNNTAQTRPFPFIFGKPAINGFAQAPAFGQQNTSLFGAPQPTTGGRRSCGSRFFVPERPVFRRPRAAKPPRCKKNCSIRSIATTITTGGGLFGTNTAPAFGTTTTSQPAFRGFSQAPQNTSLLGSTTQQQPANTSLFSQGFGTQPKTTGFAFPQQSTSLFGQPTTSNAATAPAFVGGGFGQTATAGGMFGSTPSAFGQTNNANAGSSIAKYQETIGMDTLLKNGQTNSLSTKQHCITAMKEYESKSLEEIRMEDYLANRKGPQQGVGLFAQPQQAAGGLFGATSGQQSTELFGQQQENKSLFGTNTMGTTPGFGQQPATGFGATSQASTGLFGKPFATPAVSNPGFSFGANDANKTFGANPILPTGSTSLFNRPATTSAFGQTTTGFGTFGPANTQQTSLFGNMATTSTQPAFEMNSSTGTAAFGGFGTNTSTAGATSVFGFSQAPQNTSLFGSTTQQQPANTSLFSQGFGTQPKTTGFAFPQQSTSLFGQATTSNAATAPAFGGGGFGQTATAGGMFGSTPSAFGQTNNANAGSSIAKYQETIGMDTLLKNGQTNSLSTKQHCITAMKEYESKSLEEIRMEDYLANRKGPQQGVGLFAQPQQAAGGLFGATSGQQSTGLFGQQQENKSLFGTNTMGTTPGFGQQPNTQQTGLFGNTATTSTQTASGMGVSIYRRTLSIRIERSLLRVVVEDEFGSCLYSFQNMRM